MGRDRSDRLSLAIVEEVADAEGVESIALHPPLYEVVDPDALDELFSAPRADSADSAEIVFDYLGYEVHARADGSVELRDADDHVAAES